MSAEVILDIASDADACRVGGVSHRPGFLRGVFLAEDHFDAMVRSGTCYGDDGS